MGALKNYLIELMALGKDIEQADCIEYAILSGWVTLTYNRETDRTTILAELPKMLEQFRRVCHEMEEEPV